MQRALELAESVMNWTTPNPHVGCVLCDASGQIIGEGATQPPGGAHAEVMALRDAHSKGHSTQGATAYVTLEPCSHQGRTGPCCEALVQAGVSTVHAAVADPNPLVAGAGLRHLQAHGVQVTLGDGLAQAQALNMGFFSRMIRQRPWVRLKIAASLDGLTALNNGRSQWITGEAARQDGHQWRARACAVLTGVGTVLQDDPRLDVRLVPAQRQPSAVLVDSRLDAPVQSQWFQINRDRLVYCGQATPDRMEAIRTVPCTLTSLPDGQGKVDLLRLLHDLGAKQINELHVEAGAKLNGSLLKAGLVDELLVYLAPKMLGSGQGMSNLGPFEQLQQGLPLQFIESTLVGDDLRLRAYVQGAADFLPKATG
jgi:diaminohydroxyphosphoribosylaminopyrimidine deaminase/5-amino-6-(5-phosphoribosylamino)uracil reductase